VRLLLSLAGLISLSLTLSLPSQASVLYQWITGGETISFTLPSLPQSTMLTSTDFTITGFIENVNLPNYACSQFNEGGCAAKIELVSAPGSIEDLDANFGQVAAFVCWDAGPSGCNTGVNASIGALIPTLNLGQFGVYTGNLYERVDSSGHVSLGPATEVVISDSPDPVDSPEPMSVGLVLFGLLGYGLLRKRTRNSRANCNSGRDCNGNCVSWMEQLTIKAHRPSRA
jgi:hypothetical protein